MERDRAEGRTYDPSKNIHGDAIREIFSTAKTNAWALLLENNPQGRALDYAHSMGQLEDKLRREGKYQKAKDVYSQVKEFEKQMKVK